MLKAHIFIISLFVGFLNSYSAVVDSLAFIKFTDEVSRQNDSVKTLYTIMKTITELKISVNQQNSTTCDTSYSKMQAIFPEKFRTDMKSKHMSMVTIRNGSRMLVIDDSSGTRKIIDNIDSKADGVMVNTKQLLEKLDGKPSFILQKGDSTALLEGNFNFNGTVNRAQMKCNLKNNRITEIKMMETSMKLDYTIVNGLDCIRRITLSSGNSAAAVKVTVIFDSLKVNLKLPPELFDIEHK